MSTRKRKLPSNVIRLDDARPRVPGPAQLTVAQLRAWGRAGVKVTQTAEVLGLMPDGRVVLFEENEVQPMTTFPRDGFSIEGDRYLLDWKGRPIAAYCSGPVGGAITIRFLCGNMEESMPHRAAEKLLLAQVGTREDKAALHALMQKTLRLLRERHDDCDRQRGHI